MIEGIRGEWRVDPAQLGQPFSGRAALLSPFNRLLADRKRMGEVFEFDYVLEMYKPVAERRWGYYALPILYDDRLVGKLDATADRKDGVLRVAAGARGRAVHEGDDGGRGPGDRIWRPGWTWSSRTRPGPDGTFASSPPGAALPSVGARGEGRTTWSTSCATQTLSHTGWRRTPGCARR